MDVGELQRQVEYKFAPDSLIAVQALANTYDFDEDEELLLDPDSTRDWLVRSDLAEANVEVSDLDWRLLVEFRALLRALITANLTGEHDREATEGLAALAADHPAPVSVRVDGTVELDLSPAPSVDGLISQMIGMVVRAQIEGTWSRLKICEADECRWAFYDSSRNRGGRWCRMDLCGNRAKNRTFRQRSRTA